MKVCPMAVSHGCSSQWPHLCIVLGLYDQDLIPDALPQVALTPTSHSCQPEQQLVPQVRPLVIQLRHQGRQAVLQSSRLQFEGSTL